MKNDAQKTILLLTLAGLVLIMANAAIFIGSRNGQIAPVNNLVLWGAFAVLSVCSLLWAVSLLGLQPMVVAFSYTAGGIMAFQGVRLIPDVNVAEIAAAGATYSAFGALVIGNAGYTYVPPLSNPRGLHLNYARLRSARVTVGITPRPGAPLSSTSPSWSAARQR